MYKSAAFYGQMLQQALIVQQQQQALIASLANTNNQQFTKEGKICIIQRIFP
jgi:hypothetical protein